MVGGPGDGLVQVNILGQACQGGPLRWPDGRHGQAGGKPHSVDGDNKPCLRAEPKKNPAWWTGLKVRR